MNRTTDPREHFRNLSEGFVTARQWNVSRAMECAEIAFATETAMRNADEPWTEDAIEHASEALCDHFHDAEDWKDDNGATDKSKIMADCLNLLRARAARASMKGAA